jgi:kynurenine formamidase
MTLRRVSTVHRRTLLSAIPALALWASGCTSHPQVDPTPPDFSRTVDLSQVVREDVPYLANEPPTQIRRNAEGQVRLIQIGARTGTLLQIAAAADSDLRTVDLLSPRDLALPAVVIDVRDQAQDHPGYQLSVDEITTWEQVHGRIPNNALVLLVTGWDVRWGDPQAYLALDTSGQSTAPAFGAQAARILLDERGVIGLGIDAPGSTYTPTSGHRLLLANLTSLEQLPPIGATVIIGALKLQAAASSPARVIALIP